MKKRTCFAKNSIAAAAATAAFLMTHAAHAQASEGAAKAAVQLSDVVVSASGFEQAVVDAPASISVITAQDLQGKFYGNVTDALQDIPGLSIEGGAGNRSEGTSVTIRGMDEGYVLFLVDGRPLGDSSEAYYNGWGGGSKINMLPPISAIERIEVIRGPMSSLYGTSAMGGVINIITRKNQPQWTGQVTVDTIQQTKAEASDIWQGSWRLSGPIAGDALNLTVWGNNYRRAEDRYVGGYGAKTRGSAHARLSWKFSEDQSLQIEAGRTKDKNRRTSQTSSAGDVTSTRPSFALTHDIRWRAGLSTRSFVSHEKLKMQNGTLKSSYTNLTANTKTVWGLGAHTITLGADFKKEQTNHHAGRFPGSKKTDLSRWHAALFAEDEWALTDALALTGGLRIDRNEHYGTAVTPRLYAVYKLGDAQQWAIKGGFSSGFKVPSLKQADDNIVEEAGQRRGWDKGNPALKPERSRTYEIGTTWTGTGRQSFSATYYQTRFKDKIDRETICGSMSAPVGTCTYNGVQRRYMAQYVNVDSARLSGLEVAASVPVNARTQLKVAYTLADSEITSGAKRGKPFNNHSRHVFDLGVDWQPSDAFKVWAKAKYKGKWQEEEGGRGGRPVTQKTRPAYTLVDAGASYKVNPNVQVFGGIYNLFNRQITNADHGKVLDERRIHLGVTAQF